LSLLWKLLPLAEACTEVLNAILRDCPHDYSSDNRNGHERYDTTLRLFDDPCCRPAIHRTRMRRDHPKSKRPDRRAIRAPCV